MAGKMELNISASTLEQLSCSICKGYLSCSPIRILPDGGNICGRCSPPNEDVPTYVQFSLEAIMREATFPCKFSENGCKNRLPFGYESTNNHEAECGYANGPLPEPGCSTEESVKEKTTFVLNNAELTLKLDQDVKSDSTVINPFNVRRASTASSIVNVRDWNGHVNSPPRSPRANSWNGSNNSFAQNGNNYYHRNWYPYNNAYNRRRPYNYNRRNDVVVIKGHTIYVTL